MKDISGGAILPLEPVEELIQESGFATAGFSRENHEAFARLNAEEKFGQSGFLGARGIVKTRIRGNVEGVLTQAKEAEEMVVHHILRQTALRGGGTGWLELYEKKGRTATGKKKVPSY